MGMKKTILKWNDVQDREDKLMKEKNTPKTKRSLIGRFKKESRKQSQTINEKEIDREQLVELLKQTASQEDCLEDLLVISPQLKKTTADPSMQKKDPDQVGKDLSKSNVSPFDLDADPIEDNQKRSQLDGLEENQSAPNTLMQQVDATTKHDLDLVQQNLINKRNINIEREERENSSQSHSLGSNLHEMDQMRFANQNEPKEQQDFNREAHAFNQETTQEKGIDIEQKETKELNANQEGQFDLQTDQEFEDTQNQVNKADQEKRASFPCQNLNQTLKHNNKSLKHLKYEKDHLDTSLIEQAIEEKNTKQDQENENVQAESNSQLITAQKVQDQKSEFETISNYPSYFDSVDKPQEEKLQEVQQPQTEHLQQKDPKRKGQDHHKTKQNDHPFKQKIKHYMKQWQTYFVLGAIIAIGCLLWKIQALHFFKLSFAGLILGLGIIAIAIIIFGFYYMSKKLWNILAILLCVFVFTQTLALGNELDLISNSIVQISDTNQNTGRTMGIYVPANIPISSLEALDGETIGIMAQRDDEGIHAVLTSLADQGIHVQTKSYSSLQQLYKGAKGLATRAVILNEADVAFIEDFAPNPTATKQLTKVYSLTMPASHKTTPTNKNLEVEPYTILISGSNDPLTQNAYRSNFNLLVTIHPQTKQVLTTLIPRTLAVSSSCQEQNACPQGIDEERLSLVSYNSIEALKQSLEQTLQVPIDFTVRIDLAKLIELFDLDSTLRYQQAQSVDSYIDINPGQGDHYTIYQMKQLIGNVQDLAPDDFNQELTILRVIKSIVQAQQLPHTKQIAPVLELLQQAISTSLNTDQLTQLIKMFMIFPMKMEEHYTMLASQTTTQYSPTLTETLYMAKADPNSLETIQTAIHSILQASKNKPAKIDVESLPKPSTLQEMQNQAIPTIDPSQEQLQSESTSENPEQPEQQQELEQPVQEGIDQQEQLVQDQLDQIGQQPVQEPQEQAIDSVIELDQEIQVE